MPKQGAVQAKKLLICDLKTRMPVRADVITVENDGAIHPCIGCFGCWVKTPGRCVIPDAYAQMGEKIAQCKELVLVSRCCYGSPSPFVKNVMDRSISYLHPYFTILNGEMHHRQRYPQQLDLTVYFYGQGLTREERQTAQDWARAMAVNFYCRAPRVVFLDDAPDLEAIV